MVCQDISKLSKLCSMDNDISDELKIIRRQVIEALTSQETLDCIANALEHDNGWLNEKDKHVLEILQNGNIIIGEKLIPIDRFKE